VNLSRGQKVKVTGRTNAHTVNARLMLRPEVRYIFRMERPTNFKHGTQTKHEDRINGKRRDLQGQRSRSQGHVKRLTGVGLETPKLVGMLSTGSRAIKRTSFNIKGHRSRSPGRLMPTQEMCNIFRTGRPTNFKLGTQTEHKDSHQQQAP